MDLNLDRLKHFLLTHIGAFASGFVAGLLPKNTPPEAVEVTRRGVEVLIDLVADQVEGGGAAKTLPLNVHVLFRGDALAPSAGEILAGIQKGLEENPFKFDGRDLVVKHLLNSHVCLKAACPDELTLSMEPSLDLHTATYELTVPEAKKD